MNQRSEEYKDQKIKERGLVAFDDMKYWASKWDTYPDWVKTSKARLYYMAIHDSPKIESGLISSAAWKSPKKGADGKSPITKDHITIPQFGGFMMLDNWDRIIKNSEENFLIMFNFHCLTVKLTKDQNNRLKKYSVKKPANRIKCTFMDRYKKENIELRADYVGKIIPLEEALGILPVWYCEMEKKYIV
jgi:hypothetical protein|tara:strand:+ start:1715 stop:2281 length:567 start_codon:yes stop_codon:yes gene_type:complete